jgi:hypothetical protein
MRCSRGSTGSGAYRQATDASTNDQPGTTNVKMME